MKAFKMFLAGGVAIAALTSAAPAAAQYYPGYGGAGGLDAIINAILGAGRYGGGYGQSNQRFLVEQCARATEGRLQREFASYATYGGYGGYGGYGNYGGYNNQAYASPARIVQITHVERRSSGGLKIYGTATSGRSGAYGNTGYGAYGGGYSGYGGYGAPYGGQYGYAPAADLRFNCKVDYRGRVTDIDIDRQGYGYGY